MYKIVLVLALATRLVCPTSHHPPAAQPASSPPAVTEVTQFYQDILQRSPDPGGLAYWTGEINSGAMSAAAVEQTIIVTPEGQNDVMPIVRI